MINDSFYSRSRARETPNYLYSFYIDGNHWRGMDRDNMIGKLENTIIPGVTEKKQFIAQEVLDFLKCE